MYVDGGCAMAAVSIQKSQLIMEETPDKGILEKLKGERKVWAFYIVANKLKRLVPNSVQSSKTVH